MLVHRKNLWDEIVAAIEGIDASDCIKVNKKGKVKYDQKALNKKFKKS